jgi:hypothetical protein
MSAVVYPLASKGSRWEDNELRFSLRSIERFWMPDSPVVIMGRSFPKWLRNVETVKTKGSSPSALQAACEIFTDFAWFNDDIYLTAPCQWSDLAVMRHLGDLSQVKVRDKRGKWKGRLWATVDRLQELRRTTFNTATHSPYFFNSEKMKSLEPDFDFKGFSHLWEVAYLNMFPPSAPVRCGDTATRHTKRKRLPHAWDGIRFFNHNDAGLDDNTKKLLRTMFPKKSRFEK